MTPRVVGLVVVAVVAAASAAPPPPPTIQQCIAEHGFPDVTVDDNGTEIGLFITGDSNAAQAWQTQADKALDECTP